MGNAMLSDIESRLQGFDVSHFPHNMTVVATLRDPVTGEKYAFKFDAMEVKEGTRTGTLLCMAKARFRKEWPVNV